MRAAPRSFPTLWPGWTLFRYVAAEVAQPAALGLAVFSFTFLARRLLRMAELAVNKGVGLGDLAQMVAAIFVPFAALTLPMALLLGILVAFSRLSSDQEFVAMRASGLSPTQMFAPVGLVSAGAFVLCASLMFAGYPWGFGTFRSTIVRVARTNATIGIEERIFLNEFKGVTLFAEQVPVRGEILEGVLISDERRPDRPQTIFAERGRILAAEGSTVVAIELEQGEMQVLDEHGERLRRVRFDRYRLSLDLSERDFGELPTEDRRERTLCQLRTVWEGDHPITARHRCAGTLVQVIPAEGGDSTLSYEAADGSVAKVQLSPVSDEERLRSLYELHWRVSLPFACLVLPLIGIPLGIQPQRTGRTWGFGIALGVIGAYYAVMILGESVAKASDVAAWSPARVETQVIAACWLANAMVGVVGAVLMRRAVRERPLTWGRRVSDGLASAFSWIRRRLRRA